MNWRALPPLASLRAFAAYADSGSMTAAADALGVSHPAVSQHIRSLESQLGISLVERSGPKMRLTADGDALAHAALESFGSMIAVVEELTGKEDARPLHVSTTPSFASAWLTPRLASFRQVAPDVDIMINPTPINVALKPGGVDVAIRYGKPPWEGLDSEMLVHSPMVVVGAPALIEGIADRNIDALAALPWLEELGTSEGTSWLRSYGARAGRTGTSLQMPGNLLLDAARDGQGLAVTVRCFVENDLAAGRLVLLDQSTNDATGYHLVVRPGVHRPPLKAFLKWIRRAARDADARTQGRP